jgi:hypothetical protein
VKEDIVVCATINISHTVSIYGRRSMMWIDAAIVDKEILEDHIPFIASIKLSPYSAFGTPSTPCIASRAAGSVPPICLMASWSARA